MSRNLKNVTVNKVSLVTKDERPAVEKAETKFSLFKTFNVFKKNNDNDRLESIKKTLLKKVNDLENVWQDK